MKRYLIERNVPGAGRLSPAELRAISQRSVDVLADLTGAQWIQTLVTDDHLFCLFLADGEDAIREHGRRSGLPVDAVHEVRSVTDPTTADRGVTP